MFISVSGAESKSPSSSKFFGSIGSLKSRIQEDRVPCLDQSSAGEALVLAFTLKGVWWIGVSACRLLSILVLTILVSRFAQAEVNSAELQRFKFPAFLSVASSTYPGSSLSASPNVEYDYDQHQNSSFFKRAFDLSLREDVTRPRSVFWAPFWTRQLPGFDQWWEGQNEAGLLFSGAALVGAQFAGGAALSYDSDPKSASLYDIWLGLKTTMTAGDLSTYASFRSAVRTQQLQGRFSFLRHEESTLDLLVAPFAFSELKKPSTWIPLSVVAGIAVAQFSSMSLSDDEARPPGYFIPLISYGAGVGEEAYYRGWMQPLLTDQTKNPFLSNLATSLIFALAHKSSDNPTPWIQFLMGYYFGWLTERNEWTLKQAIFVHAWWDVIAFTPLLAQIGPATPERDRVLWLPPLYLTF